MKKVKKEIEHVSAGRTKVLFNTGTQPHRSPKDYTRKPKHKNRVDYSE